MYIDLENYKTIENLSAMVEDLRKEAYAIAGFEKAIINFVQSAYDLTAHWENLPKNIEPHITMSTRYPFEMSFDELVYEMGIWLEATQSRIQLWKEGKLDV